MDLIDFSGIPYPAMPDLARVALILAKYAVLGIVPLVIPSVLLDVPIPTERIPRHRRARISAYIKALADEVGYVFYLEPGPEPGDERGVLGTGDQGRHAAARAQHQHGRAHQRRGARLSRSTRRAAMLPIVFIQNSHHQVPDPDSDSRHHAAQSAARPDPADSARSSSRSRRPAKYSPSRRPLIGLAKAAKSADAVTGDGIARRTPLRPRL